MTRAVPDDQRSLALHKTIELSPSTPPRGGRHLDLPGDVEHQLAALEAGSGESACSSPQSPTLAAR